MGRPAALVFDLDGTLVDSRRDLATAVNALRREHGLAELPVATVEAMVGEGARVLVERALGPASPVDLESALASFLVHYDRVCTATTRPYPGVATMLRRLAPVFPLALLTNKPARMARRILDALGLLPLFRVVVGGDTLAVRKPDPATLHAVARRLGVDVGDLLLIGDSAIDAATAAAAGARLALVGWGFGDRSALAATRAELRARDALELGRALLAL